MEKLKLFTVNDIVDKYRWRFAKTMPQWPHWYIIRKQKPSDDKLYHCDEDEFVWFAEHLNENGHLGSWFKTKRIYFLHNGFKYWTMGNPDKWREVMFETIIINRAIIEKSPIE